jgi:hypothetical protein
MSSDLRSFCVSPSKSALSTALEKLQFVVEEQGHAGPHMHWERNSVSKNKSKTSSGFACKPVVELAKNCKKEDRFELLPKIDSRRDKVSTKQQGLQD